MKVSYNLNAWTGYDYHTTSIKLPAASLYGKQTGFKMFIDGKLFK